jgi:hypothetical protein
MPLGHAASAVKGLLLGVQHDHAAMQSNAGWHLMQDGVVFFTFNHQSGDRGGDELAVQNWWMGMAERQAGTAG